MKEEALFQSWTDRLLDRIVLEPRFITGIDHGLPSMTTDNARARARARGIKSGIPDVLVHQGCSDPLLHGKTLWLELKSQKGRTQASQEGVHFALNRCNIPCYVVKDLHAVVQALVQAGFRIHANAWNIASETAERLAADLGEKSPAQRYRGKMAGIAENVRKRNKIGETAQLAANQAALSERGLSMPDNPKPKAWVAPKGKRPTQRQIRAAQPVWRLP